MPIPAMASRYENWCTSQHRRNNLILRPRSTESATIDLKCRESKLDTLHWTSKFESWELQMSHYGLGSWTFVVVRIEVGARNLKVVETEPEPES